jgi:ABC-type nitrate/sulfonate/bicarbonate transport system ATPase subunit
MIQAERLAVVKAEERSIYVQPGTVVRFDDVRLVFDAASANVRALDGVTFDVLAGRITTVVGPSGCGKTTLLRLVAGLTKPSSGQVLYKSKKIAGLNTEVGFITQDSNLFPWLTALDNVEFPLALRGVPKTKRRERALEWLRLVGLTGFENSYPSELSGGMQKRASIARTLIYEPDVVLMDEPFGALDAQTRMMLHHELLQLWDKQATTIIFITHDLVEAITLSDYIVVLTRRPGRVSARYEVPLRRPRNVFQIFLEPQFDEFYATLWNHFKSELPGQPGKES